MAVKVTVNLPDSTVDALKKLAEERGITMTEAMRQSIENQSFFQQEVKNGNKILIEDSDKSLRQIINV
jgi:predicted transcriptional regulator